MADVELIREKAKGRKCRKCDATEPDDGFPVGRAVCNACVNLERAEWRKRNPDKLKRQYKSYYARHADRARARSLAYYENNTEHCRRIVTARRNNQIEQIREYDRQRDLDPIRRAQKRENEKLRRAKFPEKIKASQAHKRAMRRAAKGTITAHDIRDLLRLQKGKCAICRQKLSDYHVDHIQPLSKGGANDRKNAQILCPTCNSNKHATDPIVYMRRLGRLL